MLLEIGTGEKNIGNIIPALVNEIQLLDQNLQSFEMLCYLFSPSKVLPSCNKFFWGIHFLLDKRWQVYFDFFTKKNDLLHFHVPIYKTTQYYHLYFAVCLVKLSFDNLE